MTLICLKRSPPPSPVSAVWSSDFGSLHFSPTALTGASPAVQDQLWNPAAASELLSGPAQHAHPCFHSSYRHTTVYVKSPCISPVSLHTTQYLHALQLLFAEGMLFLQGLVLDLHRDELSLHLSTLILQLQINRLHTNLHL